MKYRLLAFLFVTILVTNLVHGQAVFTGPITIKDLDTTTVNVQVQNIDVNNLADPSQGVCAVRMRMRHDFIGDVKASLISPSGQEVQLLGPAVPQAPGTQFVQWDVQFNANAFPVFPDGAFDDTWNNLNPWTGLGAAFVGTYYPFGGALEDFNNGPVIGDWKLQFIDQSENGEGVINSFEVIFCNPVDLEFAQCDPGIHEISTTVDSYCQFDEDAVSNNLSHDFIGQVPDTEFYSYQYSIFDSGALLQLANLSEISMLAGEYTICGVSYLTSESTEVENIPLGLTQMELQEYVEDNNICLTLSTVCQTITMIQAPPLVRDTVVLCEGENIVINDIVYDETGEYTITTANSNCDSVSTLVLEVLTNPHSIGSTTDSLSCLEPGALLSIGSVTAGSELTWSTINGLIDGDIKSSSIGAVRPGTYTLLTEVGNCTFSEDFALGYTADYIFAILEADTISCNGLTADITLTIEGEIDSLIWTSDFSFIEKTSGLEVTQPGVYAVEIFGSNGCNTVRGIEVIADTTTVDVSITNGELSCSIDSITISGTPLQSGNYSYEWYSGNSLIGMDSSLLVTNPGEYSLLVSSTNGCIDTSVVDVFENTTEFDVNLLNDTISCSDPVANLSFDSDLDLSNIDILWTAPSGMTAVTPIFNTSEVDTFNLNLNSDNGCMFDTTFIVMADTVSSEINISAAVFKCAEDSIQLQLTGTQIGDLISWEGPFFISVQEDPWIQEVGEYNVTVTSLNGCVASDTVVATAEDSVPQMSFSFGDINCDMDTVNIIPSNTVGFTFLWTDAAGNTNTNNIYTARDTGRYTVKFTDNINGCFGQRTLIIEEDFIDTLESVTIGRIDCDISEVYPEIIDTNLIRTSRWFDIGNSVEYSTQLIPVFNTEGTYSFDYTLENGCSGSDTVTVIREETLPMISVTTDTVSCSMPLAEIRAVVIGPQSTIIWTLPDNTTKEGYVVQTDQPGLHTGIATAAGNCMDTIYIEVPSDTLKPEVTLDVDGPITCSDDEVKIEQSSQDITEVNWAGPSIVNESSQSITVNEVGIYSVFVTGINGCIGEAEITVDSNKVYPVYTKLTDTINCVSTAAVISVVPEEANYSIGWDNLGLSGFSNNLLLPGVYPFTITTMEGCERYDSIIVVLDTLKPQPILNVSNEITCLLPFADILVSNPENIATYTWSGPGIANGTVDDTINVNLGGEYNLISSYPNGCKDEQTISVIQNDNNPNISLIGDTITCDLGKAFIDVVSDIELDTYIWSGPDMYESESDRPLVSVAGVYTVSVTGTNGCEASASVDIVDVQIFPDIQVDTFYLRCDDTPVLVSPSVLSTGATVTWLDPEDMILTIEELPASIEGEYIAIATNQDGCISLDTFHVIDEPILPLFDFETDSLFCKGDITIKSLETQDDILVSWTHPDGSKESGIEIAVGEPGDYTLAVLGINGCEDSIVVNVPDGRFFPEFDIEKLSELQCNKETVELSISGLPENRDFQFEWTSETGSVETVNTRMEVKATGEGLYHVAVTDVHTSCISQDSFFLVQDQQSFQDVMLDIQSPTCQDFADASIEITEYLGEFPPYTVSINGVSYGELTLIQFLHPGNYNMIVTDSIGCQVEKQITIEEGDYPFVNLPNDTIIQLGDSILIDPMIRPDTLPVIVEWNIPPPCDPCTTFYLSPDDTYYLEVTVSNDAGCTVTDDMLIRISEEQLQKYPNIFSPDGDGTNDVFYMPYTKGVEQIEVIRIHDWNGVKVYEGKGLIPGDESSGWNGTFRGKGALEGVYLYEAVLLLSDGSLVSVVGDLTLVR